MRTRILQLATVATLVGVAACAETSTGTMEPGLDMAEANALAPQMDGLSHLALDEHLLMLNAGLYAGGPGMVGPADVQFAVTRTCPLGGNVTLAGTVRREVNRETLTVTSHLNATSTPAACTYALRDGVTIAITGNPHIAIEAHRRRVAGRPSGVQTMTHRGSFTWSRSTGESGTCAVDITATVDPEARTRTVRGTFCGRTIERRITWNTTTG